MKKNWESFFPLTYHLPTTHTHSFSFWLSREPILIYFHVDKIVLSTSLSVPMSSFENLLYEYINSFCYLTKTCLYVAQSFFVAISDEVSFRLFILLFEESERWIKKSCWVIIFAVVFVMKSQVLMNYFLHVLGRVFDGFNDILIVDRLGVHFVAFLSGLWWSQWHFVLISWFIRLFFQFLFWFSFFHYYYLPVCSLINSLHAKTLSIRGISLLTV